METSIYSRDFSNSAAMHDYALGEVDFRGFGIFIKWKGLKKPKVPLLFSENIIKGMATRNFLTNLQKKLFTLVKKCSTKLLFQNTDF
jgi:hypothetical protein